MEIQWSLVIFTALTGCAGWALACVAIDEFLGKASKAQFLTTIIAVVVMAVGGFASVTHLSHPENIMGVLGHPTSGIFVEAVLVGLSALPAVIYAILVKREAGAGARKLFAVLAAIFGVALSFMAGESYMMSAQLTWNTILLPLGYLGTAMPAGVALYLVCATIFGGEDADLAPYTKLLLVAGIVGVVLAALYVVTANALAAAAVYAVIALLGAAAAAVIGAIMKKANAGLATTALVCAIIGAVCYRCLMWVVASPLLDFFSAL